MQQLANELLGLLLFELCLVLHWVAGGGSMGVCACVFVCMEGWRGGYGVYVRVYERGALPGASGGLWQYIY